MFPYTVFAFVLPFTGGAAAPVQQFRTFAEEAIYRRSAPPTKPATLGTSLRWNSHHTVLFKGTVKGLQESAVMADGRSWTSLLVKLPNGGTALVELGPKDYVDAQSMRLRMRAPVWVAGSKAYTNNGDSVILAERLKLDDSRHAFRRPDGTPFWR